MLKTNTLAVPVPGDPSGTALGFVLPRADADRILRPGMLIVQQTMPTLAAKGAEILAEIDDPQNLLGGGSHLLIRIDRAVDETLLRQGKLKVVGCDESKILALLAALGYEGSARAREIRHVMTTNLERGGIPFQVDGEPKLGSSIYIRIFDQSLELRFARPA